METRASDDATQLAFEAAQRATVVAAAGGDGTLGEVVNGLMQAKAAGYNGARLGLLPLGTGNDFSRCLGTGTDLKAAVEALLSGAPRAVDLGQVCFSNSEPRWFINIAGCGFDALVAQRVNDFRNRRFWRHVRGMPAYLSAVLQELAALRAASLQMRFDSEAHAQRALLCAIANATSYGGGMRVAPDALIDDGLFDICLIGDAGRGEFLRAFPGVFSGKHISHPKVTMRRASEVHLESEPRLPILVDGDVLGTTPATFRLVPRAIEVMSPR
jgi:diacylglycerol kinase (ATP)